MSRAVTLWVGSFLFLIGIVFTVIGLQNALEEQHFGTHGLVVDATVTDKSIERATRGGNPVTRYLVTYRFTSSNGKEVESSTELPVEEWEHLEAGGKFQVTYLPDAPESSRGQDTGQNTWIAVYVFLAIGSVFTLLGGGLAFYEGRSVVWSIRVSRHGLATEGTIVRVGPTSTSINRVPQWRIHYRYRDHFGRAQEGASHLMSPIEGSVWKEGDRGTVRFDRERPDLSVWTGRTL
jgi:Protein of unknown function (DUF3592)